MLATIGEDAYDPEHRHADHLSRTAHAQSEAVEVDIDHVEVGERARPPRLQPVLQRGDDTRHRALREGRVLGQRLAGSANPTGVAARQVRGDHRFIHLGHASLIARDDRRRPFLRASDVEEGGAGYGEPDYKSARDAVRANIITRVVNAYRKAAVGELLKPNEDGSESAIMTSYKARLAVKEQAMQPQIKLPDAPAVQSNGAGQGIRIGP